MHYLFHASLIEIFGLFWYRTWILLIFIQLVTVTVYRMALSKVYGKTSLALVVQGEL